MLNDLRRLRCSLTGSTAPDGAFANVWKLATGLPRAPMVSAQTSHGGKGVSVEYSNAPWPVFADDEREAVERVLASGKVNYWTGTEGREFEREFAEFTGVGHAIFVANGTVALELGLRALDLPPGSEVVTTPRTFIASSSAIVAAGLRPVFADVDPDSGNITPDSVREVITPATSAVLVVHLGGWPADMPGFQALCAERGIALIEDCSQAHGAMLNGRHVGTFSDVAAWSFCQDKIISTGGEGGMVAASDEGIWKRMWAYKDHGKSWDAVYKRDQPPGFRWLHESFGSNYRGTEMQAAIGRLQYRKLPDWRSQRTGNALVLAARLQEIAGLRVPLPMPGGDHAFYRLYAYVDPAANPGGLIRDQVIAEVTNRFHVPIFSGSCSEIYLEDAFASNDLRPADRLPNAARMTDDALAFLVHPGLSIDDMHLVADAVEQVLS